MPEQENRCDGMWAVGGAKERSTAIYDHQFTAFLSFYTLDICGERTQKVVAVYTLHRYELMMFVVRLQTNTSHFKYNQDRYNHSGVYLELPFQPR